MKNGFEILAEKTLHASLKAYYAPDTENREVPCAGGIADILLGDRVIEIQTASLYPIRKKLQRYLAANLTDVTVVFPLIRQKWLCRVDEETGELHRRKSPKTGHPWDSLYEMSHIAEELSRNQLHFRLLEVDVDEYRTEADTHSRYRRLDRRPLAYGREYAVERPEDYAVFLPESLPDTFTATDFARAVRIHARRASASLYLLSKVGFLEKEKVGRTVRYHRIFPKQEITRKLKNRNNQEKNTGKDSIIS